MTKIKVEMGATEPSAAQKVGEASETSQQVKPKPAAMRSAPRMVVAETPAKPVAPEEPTPKATPKPKVQKPPKKRAQASGADQVSEGSGDADVAPAERFSLLAWVSRTFPGHEHAFWGGVVALVVALLVFVFGFWRMLFVGLLVAVGVAVGQILDGDAKILRMVRDLLDTDRDQR